MVVPIAKAIAYSLCSAQIRRGSLVLDRQERAVLSFAKTRNRGGRRMGHKRNLSVATIVVALGGWLSIAPAAAQPADQFYKGKQIRIVVGSTAGGDYDVWARLLARHMSRHIPGNPTIIVENMPGAGTLVATNHVYNLAPRDGTVLGMPSRSMPAAAVMKVANVRFDPVKFNWIGSPEVNHLVVYINNASPIEKPADLFTHELIMGATGLAQGITVGPYLLKNVLGMKLKVVTGYRSPGDMALAASRREIDAFANTIGGAAGARRPWVENGQMRVLFNFEPEPVSGLGVPSVFDFVKTDEQRAIMTFFASNVLLGRPIMAPPSVPKDRIALLRRAFDSTMKDPAMLKEAEAMSFEISPQSGERIAALVAGVASTSPEIVARTERMSRPD
jgi:tripartite-type tricarboxylate transporter receptor subunit TctC